MDKTRRDFIKKSALGAAGLTFGSYTLTAARSKNLLGANNTINFGVAGIHNRGMAHLSAILDFENTHVGYLCDVDSRALEKAANFVEEKTGKRPKTFVDYREMLEQDDFEAVSIASPDHWHTSMAIMGLQAGKHVYVEKPCCFNPNEGELLVKAVKKYNNLMVQMGNQQRSAKLSIKAINEIKDGIIGDAYYAKAWYANNRKSIGNGKIVEVPDWLDWDLFQGPAPRKKYQDNVVHYNWHWFRHWGSGEINNNALHELDVCRWGLGVDYPVKVTSSGGRFHYDDDWEFFDTQTANYEFSDGKMITWEGKSCNPFQIHGRGRGAAFHGTKGTALLDRNSYEVYDMDNNLVKEEKSESKTETLGTAGGGPLDLYHYENFLNAIREGEELHSPIPDAVISNNYCHYGNIAQDVGRTLYLDQNTGRILNDAQATQMCYREYEPGWEIKV